MKKPKSPRVYFSFRSPYSWLAVRRLEELLPDAAERLEYIPYWDPDQRTAALLAERGAEILYQQMPKAKHLYLLHDIKRLAARTGSQVKWPLDKDPWWELPHLGWLAARREGVAGPFYRAVTRARWELGLDVCDRGVLLGVLAEAGLDGGPLLDAAAEDPAILKEGVEALVRAYEEDIFGIPYFLVGRHRFWGLDRLDDFLAELDAAGARVPLPAQRTEPEEEPVPALSLSVPYDTDTAGGCG